ncbi:hypothetical protein GCK72_012977 [Caenorhabditis remanei]|uniref:Uncharacterized protein n=1 Tax=Caenorhabditis remanei TaxID=31234 RepID=A0A6A5GPE5_CAERE|nr:hypothetical protein GCK72_012977 [Caenorhabditis remanei]KAF1756524.1 hypothetical protein GCK72_012977 [Caenorhabditis remanei]
MLRILIILFCFLGTAISLHCLFCDSNEKCKNSFDVECPPGTKCYTVKKRGVVTDRGCAHSCEHVINLRSSAICQDCHSDYCNRENVLPHNVDIEHHQNENGEIKTLKEGEGSLSTSKVIKCKEFFDEECPETTKCYTVKKLFFVTDKGCGHCEAITLNPSSFCKDCQDDYCNREIVYPYNVELDQIENGRIKILKEEDGSRIPLVGSIDRQSTNPNWTDIPYPELGISLLNMVHVRTTKFV